MAGGGKGGSQTQEVEMKLDPTMRAASEELINRARMAAQLGYQPNRGVQVAAFTPMQQAGFANQTQAMNAFGMAAPSSPMEGMPQAQMSGSGIAGYSFAPEYDRAMAMLPEGYRAAIEGLFIDPNSGKARDAQRSTPKRKASSGKGGGGFRDLVDARRDQHTIIKPRGVGRK